MNSGKLVAVVEDEIALRDNYLAALKRQGYRVAGYSTRKDALSAFENHLPDLVIIDINLAGEVEGGFDLCRDLRARSEQLPIIFLTARESELDEVSGLRLGADDYLSKRISLEHLLARVTAPLRRVDALTSTEKEAQLLNRGSLELDIDRFTASWKGTLVPLTLTEFWVVHALAKYPGHVRTREQLMVAANVVLNQESVTSQIKRIRAKFSAVDEEFPAKEKKKVSEGIDTVYGMGYRWVTEQDPLLD